MHVNNGRQSAPLLQGTQSASDICWNTPLLPPSGYSGLKEKYVTHIQTCELYYVLFKLMKYKKGWINEIKREKRNVSMQSVILCCIFLPVNMQLQKHIQLMNNLKVSRRLSTIKYSLSSSSVSWLSGERTKLSRIISVPRYQGTNSTRSPFVTLLSRRSVW